MLYLYVNLCRCCGVLCQQHWVHVSVPLPALWVWFYSWYPALKWSKLPRNPWGWQTCVSIWQWRPHMWYHSDGNDLSICFITRAVEMCKWLVSCPWAWDWHLSMSLQSNRTHFIYQNSIQSNLRSTSQSIISRERWLNITFSCVYPLIQTLSMPMGIQAEGG